MRKKTVIIKISFFLMILLQCCKNKSIEVEVRSLNDTIEVDSVYKSEIYVKSDIPYFLSFYSIYKLDTFYLPFDKNKKCGIYNGLGTTSGWHYFYGFVSCHDSTRLIKTLPFKIQYFVKNSAKQH